jgi:hypothetical protein
VCFANAFGETPLVGRDRDQVNVIRHQAPSEVLDTVDLGLLGQNLQIGLPIVIGEEDVHAANASLGDVVRASGNNDSGNARHGMSLSSMISYDKRRQWSGDDLGAPI